MLGLLLCRPSRPDRCRWKMSGLREKGVVKMLTVVVFVGDREVAKAVAGNVSDLADVSDYGVLVREREAPHLGIKEQNAEFTIPHHKRNQTVWALVQKIATAWLAKTETREEPDDD